MRICSECKQEKNEDNFYKKENRLQSKCKECFNAYCVQRWIRIKQKAVEYKGSKCCKCGYNNYYGALEFHHIQDKDYDWSKLRLKKWESITKELDKCVLLCANCHREEHQIY